MSAVVIRADARALPLAAESVDLVVTSPPYFALRSYQDGGEHYAGQVGAESTSAEYVAALLEVMAECARVLKPSGSIFVNLGDKYAGSGGWATGAAAEASSRLGGRKQQRVAPDAKPRSPVTNVAAKSLMGIPWRFALACIDDLGLILRAEIVWSKPNGLPESVTDRVRRSHEQWFHFVTQPRYFSAVDEIREPFRSGTRWIGRAQQSRVNTDRHDGGKVCTTANPLGALPGSVWSVPTEPLNVPTRVGIDHFAAFPLEWPLRFIKGWTRPSATVLDPFGGTGTTALAAHALGRTGISVDLSSDYCRLARWRTTDRGELARALRVPKPEPVADGQGELFGAAS